MLCPNCGYEESKVIDSRAVEDGFVTRRRRKCLKCGNRYTTYERLAEHPIIVIKADNSSEEFDRQKLMRGLLIACAKRPVTPGQIDTIINDIEDELKSSPHKEVRSKEIGNMALSRLANLDEVAYIRFASVYKDFQSIDEFAEALKDIKGESSER